MSGVLGWLQGLGPRVQGQPREGGYIGVIVGLYGDAGRENGNYYLGL